MEKVRGRGAYRPATSRRTATVRKTLRIDADLVERFEKMQVSGETPLLTQLVERWMREYLDGSQKGG